MQEASHLSFPEIRFDHWLLFIQAIVFGLVANYLYDRSKHDRTKLFTYAVILQATGIMITGWIAACQMPLDPKDLQQHPAYLIRGMLWLQAGGIWSYDGRGRNLRGSPGGARRRTRPWPNSSGICLSCRCLSWARSFTGTIFGPPDDRKLPPENSGPGFLRAFGIRRLCFGATISRAWTALMIPSAKPKRR